MQWMGFYICPSLDCRPFIDLLSIQSLSMVFLMIPSPSLDLCGKVTRWLHICILLGGGNVYIFVQNICGIWVLQLSLSVANELLDVACEDDTTSYTLFGSWYGCLQYALKIFIIAGGFKINWSKSFGFQLGDLMWVSLGFPKIKLVTSSWFSSWFGYISLSTTHQVQLQCGRGFLFGLQCIFVQQDDLLQYIRYYWPQLEYDVVFNTTNSSPFSIVPLLKLCVGWYKGSQDTPLQEQIGLWLLISPRRVWAALIQRFRVELPFFFSFYF